MYNKIKSILNPQAEKQIELVILRNCSAGGESFEAGQTVVLGARRANELITADCATNQQAVADEAQRQTKLDALIPPPIEPKPLPSSFESLPAPFADWWNLNQSGLALIHRLGHIEEKLIAMTSKNVMSVSPSAFRGIPDGSARNSAIAASARTFIFEGIDEEEVAAVRHLEGARQRLSEDVASWQAANSDKLFSLHVSCSDCYLSESGQLARNCRDTHEVGRALFVFRIAALNLAPRKIDDLFSGSGDFVRYVQAAPIPAVQDLKMLWYLDGGKDSKSYCSTAVPGIADLLHGTRERQSQVDAILKQGKAELAKATKAQTAAA